MMLTKRKPILVGWLRGLITTDKLQEIENKIPSVTSLVTTAPRNSKATEIEKKT